MNTFQKIREENESLFQRAKHLDASTEVKDAMAGYEETLHKFMIRLKVKVDNYDFDGAIALLHDGILEIEQVIIKLRNTVEEVEREDLNDDDVNIYDPMEDSNDSI